MIIVIAVKQSYALQWARDNIKPHDRVPVCYGIEQIDNLRGLREGYVVLVGDLQIPPEFLYRIDRCTIIRVKE